MKMLMHVLLCIDRKKIGKCHSNMYEMNVVERNNFSPAFI